MDAALVADPGAFLREAAPLLLADEARHNLLLGIAGALAEGFHEEHRLWLVRADGRAVAAALRTPPFNLVLARPASSEALAALVDALADEELPGVTGALPEVDEFAARWAGTHAVVPRRSLGQWIYALSRVKPPPRPPGAPREATAADRELVVRWFLAFANEVVHEGGPGPDHAERAVDRRFAVTSSGFLLWEDAGRAVSLAGWSGRTPNGIRIGPVYTPPELRGRGYATALTADLSRRLLAAGHRFCFLYTDAANATSNAIYERIGYRRVCESAEIAFDPA